MPRSYASQSRRVVIEQARSGHRDADEGNDERSLRKVVRWADAGSGTGVKRATPPGAPGALWSART